jgi:hypothetical protein
MSLHTGHSFLQESIAPQILQLAEYKIDGKTRNGRGLIFLLMEAKIAIGTADARASRALALKTVALARCRRAVAIRAKRE